MTTPTSSYASRKNALLAALKGEDQVLCYVPAGEPVNLAGGLEWLESAARSGLEIDFHVVHDDSGAIVWLRSWHPDEIRPDWPGDWPERRD